jgi:hypothetical protein
MLLRTPRCDSQKTYSLVWKTISDFTASWWSEAVQKRQEAQMFNRFCFRALLLAGLLLPLASCEAPASLTSITVTPSTANIAVGTTVQLTATGTYSHGSHPTVTLDITDQVTWASTSLDVATVSSTGLVTGVGSGSIPITASATGFTGLVTGSADITVASGVGSSTEVVSLAILPGSQSVASPTETSQFLAIGTTLSGATLNLTTQSVWLSSSVSVATVGASTGLATAVGQGSTTITAIYTNTDQTVVTGSATFAVLGGITEQIVSLSIIPSAQALSSTGQTGQFTAIGTSGSTGNTEDVTNSAQLTWSSSIPSIATITSGLTAGNGLASGVSPGTTYITAQWTNTDKSVVESNTATITVSITPAPEPLLSIVVLPSTLTTDNLYGTGQFLAYGTFSTAPTLMDITNGFSHVGFPPSCTELPCPTVPVTWISAMPDVFPVNSSGAPGATAGLVTADGSGNAVVYVTATNPDGTVVYSPTVTFYCPLQLPTYSGPGDTGVMTNPGTCNQYTIASGLLVTLTVYNAGLNTTNWLVTAPSATGTPDVIHCGPGSTSGGSVCIATYPVGTTITLTATQNPADPGPHGTFGGWSWNCENTAPVTAAGPNSCTVYLGEIDPITDIPTSNVSVGAIFN